MKAFIHRLFSDELSTGEFIGLVIFFALASLGVAIIGA
jgi:hypothetical protein